MSHSTNERRCRCLIDGDRCNGVQLGDSPFCNSCKERHTDLEGHEQRVTVDTRKVRR